jgi:hypothetical protein
MINPDGVIVGNYRCSLAGRDLNRNYRHPRKESFPTIYGIKKMMDDLTQSGKEVGHYYITLSLRESGLLTFRLSCTVICTGTAESRMFSCMVAIELGAT